MPASHYPSGDDHHGRNRSTRRHWKPSLGRGVNLGGWLSQQFPGTNVRTHITAGDIDRIRTLGFDHVRVPVDETVLYPRGLGAPADSGILDVLGSLGRWCAAAEMPWIADLHRMRGHTFLEGPADSLWSSPDAAEKLAAIWIPLLRALAEPRGLVIDLLNEPSHPDPRAWYSLAEQACSLIWTRFPEQWVIIEAVRDTGGPAAVGALQAFPDQQPSHVIYGFHFYEPTGFTHQSAAWSSASAWSQAPQPYPGHLAHDPAKVPGSHLPQVAGTWDRERITGIIGRAAAWSARTGIRLHCGEFGVYLDAPRHARYNWISDVISALEYHGIGWCYWTYRDMGFGIYCHTEKRRAQPEYRNGVDDALLGVLLHGT